jgi:pyruvate,orthophosphate dikinase
MKNLLGGKGANLAEMARLGLPVPPGFTISTECCNDYFERGGCFPETLESEVMTALAHIEDQVGMTFGDPEAPLLVSCRSGARSSMPGMMETILNVGLCSKTIPGLAARTGNEWFVYDAYRRLIMMYSDVVMEKAEQVVPEDGMGIRLNLEMMMNNLKNDKGYEHDTDISVQDMQALCDRFKKKISQYLNKEFPDDPREQLIGAIGAVFKSWNGKRGDGRQCPGHGVRQHGEYIRHRRGIHQGPGHGQKSFFRRMAGQCPGGRRGGRHPDPQSPEQRDQKHAEPAPAISGRSHAGTVCPAV